jgi:hypothetical protein
MNASYSLGLLPAGRDRGSPARAFSPTIHRADAGWPGSDRELRGLRETDMPGRAILSGSKGFAAPAYDEIGQAFKAAGLNAYLVHVLSPGDFDAHCHDKWGGNADRLFRAVTVGLDLGRSGRSRLSQGATALWR